MIKLLGSGFRSRKGDGANEVIRRRAQGQHYSPRSGRLDGDLPLELCFQVIFDLIGSPWLCLAGEMKFFLTSHRMLWGCQKEFSDINKKN